MRVPYFRAKDKDSNIVVEGFFFAYPKTTYCFEDAYKRHPAELAYCICFNRMTDWGLPNRPVCCTIDINTLELIGYVETGVETYAPDWLNRIKGGSVKKYDCNKTDDFLDAIHKFAENGSNTDICRISEAMYRIELLVDNSIIDYIQDYADKQLKYTTQEKAGK